jgi:hypothetical protein
MRPNGAIKRRIKLIGMFPKRKCLAAASSVPS